MKTDVRLSTKFLTAQGAHQVGVLLTLAGEAPARRAPINVALVLDRSGSMGGPPLAAAKEAAIRFARFLGPDDRLTVVTFDDHVRTIFGPAPAGDAAAAMAIAAVHEGGSTNLSGGWLKGRAHVEEGLVEGVYRLADCLDLHGDPKDSSLPTCDFAWSRSLTASLVYPARHGSARARRAGARAVC